MPLLVEQGALVELVDLQASVPDQRPDPASVERTPLVIRRFQPATA